MNVLVDRHHAGLFYSLQLLFEDRLGLSVYTPVGHEWWDLGAWRFGEVLGDDRLARQFLNLDDPDLVVEDGGATPAREFVLDLSGRYYTMHDRAEFPDREIRGVTPEQFLDLGDWGFVVASVQENQRGFAELAARSGARYVYQVGNRGQQIDWSLDPLVLASAIIEPVGRCVVYHQEYEKDTVFRFRSPRGSRVVSS